jgi:1-acyl-sn-glycerol-3-phosphate acyltransferase
MLNRQSVPPKPVSETWRPELTRLPCLHWARRCFRAFARGLCRVVIALCTRRMVEGLENFPRHGPALVVINHLGDADAPLLVGSLPVALDALGKIEMYDFPVLGRLMDWYGVIWLHRGLPDRRAIRAAMQGFSEGRIILIAPEGRYSLIGGLEEGSSGAAYLALKADVSIFPVVVTGTENEHVYGHLKRLQRAPVGLKVGKAFRLDRGTDRRRLLKEATRQIMQHLAALLPAEYRGAYGDLVQ